tara:strand:- start:24 stop:413 length:390 start_codon:yes stop_codon:yes gene_type:complete
MIEQLGLYLISVILGIMLFFSFVVAPVTFSSLNDESARKFIRKIFPYYYIINLLIGLIVLSTFIYLKKYSVDFFLILLICVMFAISNFILMPLINKYRDNNQDKKFQYSHFTSVIINFIQIIFLVFLLI